MNEFLIWLAAFLAGGIIGATLAAHSVESKIYPKLNKILEYAYEKGQGEVMWSAVIMSIIMECDFRDAGQRYKQLKGEPWQK